MGADALGAQAQVREVSWAGTAASVALSVLPHPSPAAPRLLLLHGNPGQLGHWSPLAAHLAAWASVAAFDQPGSGDTPARADVRPEACAQLALAVLDAVGWQGPVHVVGHSHGGLVALALARLAPTRVASLTLISSAGAHAHAAYRLLAAPGVAGSLARVQRACDTRALARRLVHACARLLVRRVFAPDVAPAGFAAALAEGLLRRPGALRAMAARAQGQPCAQALRNAPRLRCRLLALHGHGDVLVPAAHVQALVAAVPACAGASLEVLDGGHMLHVTHAGPVARRLRGWVEHGPSRIPGPPPSGADTPAHGH